MKTGRRAAAIGIITGGLLMMGMAAPSLADEGADGTVPDSASTATAEPAAPADDAVAQTGDSTAPAQDVPASDSADAPDAGEVPDVDVREGALRADTWEDCQDLDEPEQTICEVQFCLDNPGDPNCVPQDPCDLDPNLPSCNPDPCETDPGDPSCNPDPCELNPTNPICDPTVPPGDGGGGGGGTGGGGGGGGTGGGNGGDNGGGGGPSTGGGTTGGSSPEGTLPGSDDGADNPGTSACTDPVCGSAVLGTSATAAESDVPTGPTLPDTGAPVGTGPLAAAGLLMVGAGVLLMRPRRARHRA